MANPIKTSDILKDDNLDALIAKIKQLEGVIEGLTAAMKKQEAEAVELEASTKKLNGTTASGRDEIVKNAKAAEDVERAHKAYNKVLSEENAKIQELRVATATLTNLKKNEAKAALAAEGSYNKLSAQYSIIKLTLNAMSKAEREGTENGRQLVKTANAIYQEMKRLQAETGKNTLNVGNYSEALEGANKNLGEMKKELAALRNTSLTGKTQAEIDELNQRIGTLVDEIGNYSEALEGANKNLGEMKKELAALRNASFTGKTQAEIDELNQRIGTLVDEIGDLRATQQALGTETGELVAGSLQFFVAGLEGIAAGAKLVGLESPALKGLQNNILELIAISQALAAIEDVLAKKTLQTTYARLVSSATTAKDTVIRWANTVATTAAARAEDAKTVAITRGNVVTRGAAAVQWLWNAALSANPIGLVVVAISALVAGIAVLVASQRKQIDEAERLAIIQRVNNELTQQAAINAVDEKVKVENLISILKNENTTKRDKKKALDELNRISPEYFKGLALEKDGVEAVAKAYTEKYLPALERRAKFEAANQKLIEIEKKLLDTQTRLAETKPNYLDAAIALTKNLGDRIAATSDLTTNWTEKLQENRQVLEDEKKAVLNFIQTNNLATEALNVNTDATAKNTKAKKQGLAEAEKMANAAALQLQYQRELADLLRDLADTPLLQEMFGGGEQLPDKAYSIGRNIAAAFGEGLVDSQPLQSIFDANAEKDIKRRAELIGKSAGDGLKSGIGESLNVFERLAQGESIYDLLGINITDEGKAQVKSALDFAKQQLTDFLNFRTQIANRNVANADREVSAAENALNREVELQAAGLANNAAARQKDLADAQQKQREAIRAQEQAQRAQQRIQTIEQAVNLITAISKIYSTVPFPLNIGAVAVMLGAFASAKIQAAQLSRREFAEGDLTILEGGSHASGNDIFVGHGKDGRPEFAEGGEARMILSRKSTRKYRSLLPEIFHSLKAGTFENEFTRQANAAMELPLIVNTGGGQLVNMRGVERGIGRLIDQGAERQYTDSKGRLVVKRGNRTTVYVN